MGELIMRYRNFVFMGVLCVLGACQPQSDVTQLLDRPNRFDVFFDYQQSNLTEAAQRIVADAAEAAKAPDIMAVTLLVHTEMRGEGARTEALSLSRADVIRTQLIKDGVPAGKITSGIVENADPVVPTQDGVHEPRYRRTEIILR